MRPVLTGDEYRALDHDSPYTFVASLFLRASMLDDAAGKKHDAAWHRLHTAWALDDAAECSPAMTELARTTRSKASDRFTELLNLGQTFAPDPGASETVLVDCLRRAGRGAEAMPIIERAMSLYTDETILKVLAFSRTLIERGDEQCHQVEEAFGIVRVEQHRRRKRRGNNRSGLTGRE
jgi:hypothetical protein